MRLKKILMIVGLAFIVVLGNGLSQGSLKSLGSFAVVIGAKVNTGYATRLAMYSFQDGGVMREDFWAWFTNVQYSYGASGLEIGSVSGEDTSVIRDQRKRIVMPTNHLDVPVANNFDVPKTLYGTWSVNKNIITINWNGVKESWRLSKRDNNLNELNLLKTDDAPNATYYSYKKDAKELNAQVAGWGFGARGWGFGRAEQDISAMNVGMKGAAWQYNDDSKTLQGGWAASFDAYTFKKSSNGVLKGFVPKSKDGYADVYQYLGLLGDLNIDGVRRDHERLARRVIYQHSHDEGPDGNIMKRQGHTQPGLQIIDAAGQFRGLVMAEISLSNGSNIVGAAYYLK